MYLVDPRISSDPLHEVRALRALMHAACALRENGDDMKPNFY